MEHISRYGDFATYLAEHGFLVVGHDHIGHGESAPSRKELGYFPPKDGDVMLREDLHRHRLLVQQEYPDVPYFMMGHSMGSYVLRRYLADYGEGLAGAIIMGTGFVPGAAARAGVAVCQAMAKVKGWHHRSLLVTGLTFGKDYKGFDMTGKDPANSWLTRDTETVELNLRDPLCRFLFTLGGYVGLFRTVQACSRQTTADAVPPSLPILLVSGDQDPVGAFGKGVRKVETMFRKARIRDLTCRLYEGDRHEILNELNREQVYEELRRWMEDRV
jgi:alpha-beta hydrolase superfamily lysophospholipase